jgi:hypothetical protein
MAPDEAASRKKSYNKATLKRLSPQEALSKINCAAQAGDKNAKAILNRVHSLHRS